MTRAAGPVQMSPAPGPPTPDPTANVLALVDAAVHRLDDLRQAETGKREAISRHLHEIIELRALHAQQLRGAEAKRIDAIREVDVQAAKAVATQVATSAETLRSLVDSTARALAAQMAAQFSEMSSRIASLEKSAYEGAGKGQATEPQMTELLREMKQVRGTSSAGMSSMFGWIIGVVGILIAGISVAFAILK